MKRPRLLNKRPGREQLWGPEAGFSRGQELWPDDTSPDRGVLADAIESLPSPYRDVLEHRYYGRMTHTQIAKEMGWKDRRWSAVYLARARKLLKRQLLTKD